MEYVKEVLIKEIDGGRMGDKVFIINHLPKKFLYQSVMKRVIDPNHSDGRLVPDFKVVDGHRVLTGATTEELLPGIEMSQTGDGAYCFFTQYLEAQYRLRDIDNYLKATAPVTERLPQREPYASQPGVLSSGTRPLNTLPRVELPEPVSPPAQAVQAAGSPSMATAQAPVEVVKKARKPMTEEQKLAARERMARAREAKKSQPAQ